MNNPLISIIMPVYNTEAYVEEAVRSVLAQTCSRWELLIVDDGSTDGSGAVCDALAREDSRIRVFHISNGGVSRARNLALQEAQGAYLCFLDSDDCYEPAYLESLLSWAGQAASQLACCGFYAWQEGKLTVPVQGMPNKLVSQDDFLYEAFMGSLSLPLCCWTWLIPRACVGTVRFDESLSYGEDSLFIGRILKNCTELYYDPTPLYRYRLDRPGNTVTELSLKKAESQYRSVKQLGELYDARSGRAGQALSKFLVESAAACARIAFREKDKAKGRAYRKYALKHWQSLKSCPAIGSKDKCRLLAYVLAPLASEKWMLRRYGRV